MLQARYVSAAGEVVKAGGPTVKNVSGFDLCRLLVGSRGTLGFLGDVILRTRPRARYEQWFSGRVDPDEAARPAVPPDVGAVGRHDDVGAARRATSATSTAQVAALDLQPTGGPPPLPTGGRWSIAAVGDPARCAGRFVAEVGVGIVHHAEPPPRRTLDPAIVALHRRIKRGFDPTGRLNPGVDVLDG